MSNSLWIFMVCNLLWYVRRLVVIMDDEVHAYLD
jgi:hypothetical protein